MKCPKGIVSMLLVNWTSLTCFFCGMCRYVLVDLGRKNRTFQDNTEMVHLDDANILDNLRSLVFA